MVMISKVDRNFCDNNNSNKKYSINKQTNTQNIETKLFMDNSKLVNEIC